MQTMKSMPASTASMMPSAAPRAGTKMQVASAPVASLASRTVSKTGTPWTVMPPLPGVTPPTTFVPYSIIWAVWNSPSRPVMPWTMTVVFLSTRMLIV